MSERPEVRVLDAGESCPELPIVDGEGVARAIVWPGVGATLRSMHRINLSPRSRTVEQRHSMEAVYYVMRGTGAVRDLTEKIEQALVEGSMVHVGPDTAYVLIAGPDGIQILGGPCPADPSLYEHIGRGPHRLAPSRVGDDSL